MRFDYLDFMHPFSKRHFPVLVLTICENWSIQRDIKLLTLSSEFLGRCKLAFNLSEISDQLF